MINIASVIGLTSFALVILIYPVWWKQGNRVAEGSVRATRFFYSVKPLLYVLLILSILLYGCLCSFVLSAEYQSPASYGAIFLNAGYILLVSSIVICALFLFIEALHKTEQTRKGDECHIQPEDLTSWLVAFAIGISGSVAFMIGMATILYNSSPMNIAS